MYILIITSAETGRPHPGVDSSETDPSETLAFVDLNLN